MRIAFVGSGQLARMIGEATKDLNINIRCAGKPGSSAFYSCESFTQPLDDDSSLAQFLHDVDVFSFESEHEGLEIAERVSAYSIPVRPHADFVRIAGDRLLEKKMLQSCLLPIAPFFVIDPELDEFQIAALLEQILDESPNGIVVKTRRGGYDGKGQWVLPSTTKQKDIESCSREIAFLTKEPGCIVEHLIDFTIEVSILATRSMSGEIKAWPLTHNIHEDSILRRSSSPITNLENIEALEKQALDIVRKLCTQNDYVGTIAIECFVTGAGLIINEIAPRVHNSGHWTIEGATTSQFEQHARAVVGMELTDTKPIGHSIMINIIGREVDIEALSSIHNVFVHWYDKEVRPKRKVGHITIVGKNESECLDLEAKVLKILDSSNL